MRGAIAALVVLFVAVSVSATPRRLCGKVLLHQISQLCTWEGESYPCFHRSTTEEEEEVELGSTRRHHKHNSLRRKIFSTVNICCTSRCEIEDLAYLCCTEREARFLYNGEKQRKTDFNLFVRRSPYF